MDPNQYGQPEYPGWSNQPPQNPYQQPPTPNQPVGKYNTMSILALICGIASLVCLCCSLSFIPGALGILFALFSRGAGKMNGMAKTGLGLSIGGITVFFCMIITTVVFLFSSGKGHELIQIIEQADTTTEAGYEEFQEDLNNYVNEIIEGLSPAQYGNSSSQSNSEL